MFELLHLISCVCFSHWRTVRSFAGQLGMLFSKVLFDKIYYSRHWFCVKISHLSLIFMLTSRILIQKAVLICYLMVTLVKVYWAYAMSEVLCWIISVSHLFPLNVSLREGSIYLHFSEIEIELQSHCLLLLLVIYSKLP